MPVALTEYQAQRPSVTALGTFDGVHLGHLALLNEAKQRACDLDAASLAFTFSMPPGNFLGYPKPLLLPPDRKFRMIEDVVDQAVIAEFPDLVEMTPQDFVQQVLVETLNVKGVVVGYDYRFGKDRAGDLALLRELGQQHGFEVYEITEVEAHGDVVSSTRIRHAIRAGDIKLASQLLRHPPLLMGTVVHGEGRGKGLGFPTANLAGTDAFVCPDQGIFAAVACLEKTAHPASVYIGTNPTFDGAERVIEVHLMEGLFPPLYEETLLVHLIDKVRDDEEFADADALTAQIQADVEQCEQILKSVDLDSFCP